MRRPYVNIRRNARKLLDEIFDKSTNIWVIHYACSDFSDPRIASISLRNLETGQTRTFSSHLSLQSLNLDYADAVKEFERIERHILQSFWMFLQKYQNAEYLHWNMRDASYGFQVLEQRSELLSVEPYRIRDDTKHDLAKILIDIYGDGYAKHPRLKSLCDINNLTSRELLEGKDEAICFNEQRFAEIQRSNLSKVRVIADLATKTYQRTLDTELKWHSKLLLDADELHYLIWKNSIISFITFLISITASILSIFAYIL